MANPSYPFCWRLSFARFKGHQIFDSECGLYYYRARYYDPSSGRFLSEDPTGFDSGQNFYSYVFNRPINWADPAGFSAQDVNKIKNQCKKCTQELTNQGQRYDAQGRLGGWWNDLHHGLANISVVGTRPYM